MSSTTKQGIFKRQTLTDAEMAEIAELAQICDSYEHLHMRVGWIVSASRPLKVPSFLYYQDEKLVGYLALSGHGPKAKEATGMVHPDYRRTGIFTALLTAAKEDCRPAGVEKLLLICEDSSPSGQAFIAAIGPRHDSSEYDMVLGQFHESMHFDDRLFFRQASRSDVDALAKIMAEDMDEPVEEVWPMADGFFQEPNCTTYIAMFGEAGLGCKEPVGCLRVYELEDEFGIYGFVVRPEYRRRGHGRQTLEETIRTLQARSQKRIMLEVDTENTKAINLYRSCGFEVRTSYGYYAVDIT